MIKRKTLHSIIKAKKFSFVLLLMWRFDSKLLFRTNGDALKNEIFKRLFKLLRAIYLIQQFNMNVIVIILWLMQ